MSNLFVPGQPQRPQPGLQIQVTRDATKVLLTVTATASLSADEAGGLASAILRAAAEAQAMEAAISAPLVIGGNGQ